MGNRRTSKGKTRGADRKQVESGPPTGALSSWNDRVAAVVTVLPFLACLLVVLWDVLGGTATFIYRDLGTTHRPAQAIAERIGAAAINPYASFGQSFRSNPNMVLRYPFPTGRRWFGLHIVGHIALCFAGMLLLFRIMGLSLSASLFGASTFVFSGYFACSSSFFNGVTTLGWVPWVLSTAVLLSRRGSIHRFLFASVVAALLSISGEPVLIALTVLASLAVVYAERSWRAVGLQMGATLLGMVITAPIHLETVRAALDSSRMVTGYSYEAATAASLHPARLLEWIIPFIFGRPDRILAGGWWGFEVSLKQMPLYHSLAIAAISLLFAFLAAGSSLMRQRRMWILMGIGSLVLAMGAYLPGARQVFSALPLLRHARYPIKFMMLTTLSISVLAAMGYDRWWRAELSTRTLRRWSGINLILAAIALVAGLAMAVHPSGMVSILSSLWWDPAWKTPPDLVLPTVVTAAVARMLYLALVLSIVAGILAWSGSRNPSEASPESWAKVAAGVTLLMLTLGEGIYTASPLFVILPTATTDQRTPMMAAALAIPGTVFERAGKDLDPIRKGKFGHYTDDSLRSLMVAQSRQAWALAGSIHGIRYAYDRDPDGSYTDRNRIMEQLMGERSWPKRLKWLRADGIGSVISYNVPPGMPGLTRILTEGSVGVPATLYRVDATLPEVRRYGQVVASATPLETVRLFELVSHDPERSVVIEAPASVTTAAYSPGPALIVREAADAMTIETSGTRLGMLFVARSYRRMVTASIEGRMLPVYPANVHLIGIPVPAGRSTVELTLGR